MYFGYFITVSEQGQTMNISVDICLQYTAITLQINKSDGKYAKKSTLLCSLFFQATLLF